MTGRRGCRTATAITLLALFGGAPVHAETAAELRRELDELLERARRLERRIEALEGSERSGEAASDAAALDAALETAREAQTPPPASTESAPAPLATRRVGRTSLELLDLSVDAMMAVGSSTAEDDEIEFLEAGAHDPKRRGFTLQQVELSLAAAVDPYFTAEVYAIATDEEVELEEAFATTTALPASTEAEAGYFLTEFGRMNPRHPHAWDWVDQPVINSRIFGGEGLRNPGARVGWLLPLPWYAQIHVGAQNAGGDTARSFLTEDGDDDLGPVGRYHGDDTAVHDLTDLLYLTRIESSVDVGESLSGLVGGSALFGPNVTGGRTYVYGGDLTVKWRPPRNRRGWPFLVWQSEVMTRSYEVDTAFDTSGRRVVSRTLHDTGLYSQVLWGFRPRWAAGLRYEFAGGSGSSLGGRSNDPARADRHRVSPLLVWHPSEFSRLRLQYDFDDMALLEDGMAHSVWLSLEVLYGAHPAHGY